MKQRVLWAVAQNNLDECLRSTLLEMRMRQRVRRKPTNCRDGLCVAVLTKSEQGSGSFLQRSL